MKNKKLLIGLAVPMLAMSVITGFILEKSENSNLLELSASKTYTTLIDKTNGLVTAEKYSDVESTNTVKTKTGHAVTMGYVNSSKVVQQGQENAFIQMHKGDSYYGNKTAFTNIIGLTFNFNCAGTLTLTTGNTPLPTANSQSVTSGTKITLDGSDYFFMIKPSKACYINSILIEYSCTTYLPGDTPAPNPDPDQGTPDPDPGTDPNPGPDQPGGGETTPTEGQTITLDSISAKVTGGYGAGSVNVSGYTFNYSQGMGKNNAMGQFKAGSEYYNSTPIENITSIEVTLAQQNKAVNLFVGNSQQPKSGTPTVNVGSTLTWTGGPVEYFRITSSGAFYLSSIVIKTGPNSGGGTPDPDPNPNPDQPGGGGDQGGGSNPGGGEYIPDVPPAYTVPTAPLTGYYQDVDIHATGATLLSQVRDAMVRPHKKYTSYGECRGSDAGGYYNQTDYDPNNKNNIIMFYTRASISEKWSGGPYNREHVWPKSLSSGNYVESNGGSDLHHIRPDFKDTNGKRSSKLFGDCPGGSQYDYTYGGRRYFTSLISGNTWEPIDAVKGDAARIVLYVFTHYNNPTNLANLDGLNGTITSTATSPGSSNSMSILNVVDAPNEAAAFALLKRWHNLDPVDQLEINRNNGVANIQGNRNPFIDHPWVVNEIWK